MLKIRERELLCSVGGPLFPLPIPLLWGPTGRSFSFLSTLPAVPSLPAWAIVRYNPLKRPFIGLIMGIIGPNSPSW